MAEKKQKRIALYISETDYNRLQSKLRLKGRTVSGWFRQMVAKYLESLDT